VAPNAPESTTSITIVNGLQTIMQPFAFQITPGNPRAVILSGRVENAMPGVLATAMVVNTPTALSSGAVQLFLNDRPVAVSGIQDNRLTFQIPAGTPVGVATLRLQVGNDSSLPIAFAIDAQPPQITTVLVNGQSYEAARGVRAGDLVAVQVSNLADPNSAVAASRVKINFCGTQFPAAQVLVSNGGHAVTFVAPGVNASDNLPLTISIDGRSSAAFSLAVR
jgi:hypothetical protein